MLRFFFFFNPQQNIGGQATGESEFLSKLKGGARGFLEGLGVLLPLFHSALLKTARHEGLEGEVVRILTTTRKVFGLHIDEHGERQILRTKPESSKISLQAPLRCDDCMGFWMPEDPLRMEVGFGGGRGCYYDQIRED